MKAIVNTTLGLQVADVMSPKPIVVSVNATMGEAAEVLATQDVGGVPVVDEMGHCVGVLSARDFSDRDRPCGPSGRDASWGTEHAVVQSSSGTPLRIEWVEEDSVRQHMHDAVQTVCDQTPIIRAATMMCSEHIHHLIVLDESSRPVGIVSSLDLLRAFLREFKN